MRYTERYITQTNRRDDSKLALIFKPPLRPLTVVDSQTETSDSEVE